MINKLREYVTKVLPLVYDDSLSYYEVLAKVTAKINEVVDETNTIAGQITINFQEWLESDEGQAVLSELITEQLNQQYTDLVTRVGTLEGAVETLDDQIDSVEDSLTDSIGDVQDQVNINKALLSLHGVKCLLMGNSYARGTGGTIGKGWCYYFQQRTGCDATIIQQAGGDFAAVGNENSQYPNMTYADAFNEWVVNLTAAQKAAYQLVVVGGGYNDMSHRNEGGIAAIESGIANFCNRVRTQLPNAKIVIVPLFSTSMGFATMEHYLRYAEGWVRYAALYGAQTCVNSIFWFMGKEEYNSGDNIHLNDTGYWTAGGRIAAVVNGWDGNLIERVAGSTLADGVTGYFRAYRQNQKVTLDFDCDVTGGVSTTFVFANIGAWGIPSKSVRPGGIFIYGTPRSYIPIAVIDNGEITFQGAGQTMPEDDFRIYGSVTYDLTFGD